MGTLKRKSFTLIELLIVIAILGILSAAILIAINPGKRTAQARDAQRKNDISAIANALVGYYTLFGAYPFETTCDTSRGSKQEAGNSDCSGRTGGSLSPGNDWDTPRIRDKLITEGFLKKMPVDPINNATYYYKYEPGAAVGNPGCASPTPCTLYWIGVRLEAPDNPADQGKVVFRCSDDPSLADGTGCKTVTRYTNDAFPNAGGTSEGLDNFDNDDVSY